VRLKPRRLYPRGKCYRYQFSRRLCGLQLFTKTINCKRTNINLHQASNIPVSVENIRYRRASKMIKILNTHGVDIVELGYNVIRGTEYFLFFCFNRGV
jgi:hypothetical protein